MWIQFFWNLICIKLSTADFNRLQGIRLSIFRWNYAIFRDKSVNTGYKQSGKFNLNSWSIRIVTIYAAYDINTISEIHIIKIYEPIYKSTQNVRIGYFPHKLFRFIPYYFN